jgi:hypothetical protein
MEQYLCKDCKHSFLGKSDWPFYPFLWLGQAQAVHYQLRCRMSFVEEQVEVNLVTGNEIKPAHYQRCTSARSKWNETGCGESAKFWTPKRAKHLFHWIKKAA